MENTKKIYIDTNFLLIPAQFKVDIFEELKRILYFPYELHVLNESIIELKQIKNKPGKAALQAKLTLALLEHKIKQKSLNITAFSKELGVDDILVELAEKNAKDTLFATQDLELKRRIWEKGAKVIVLKNKKYLEIT